jgi:hypothetical protein
MWDLATGDDAKQRKIAEGAFSKVDGKYELDLAKPMFEEFHRRENKSHDGWSKEGKPRMLWAMEMASAGGTFF